MAAGTVKFFRDAKNFTQEYVAGVLGISQPAYSKIESGVTNINDETAVKLAELYEVDKEVFMLGQNAVINYNVGTQDKVVVKTDNYYESGKELIQIITEKADFLLVQLQEQQKQLQQERTQLYELLSKLAEKL
jgi:transcriptional regulator with XRE-family HTH domain